MYSNHISVLQKNNYKWMMISVDGLSLFIILFMWMVIFKFMFFDEHISVPNITQLLFPIIMAYMIILCCIK
jgi:hypothetical protein